MGKRRGGKTALLENGEEKRERGGGGERERKEVEKGREKRRGEGR